MEINPFVINMLILVSVMVINKDIDQTVHGAMRTPESIHFQLQVTSFTYKCIVL